MTMTATLLLVSGVPMSAAKECAMPMPAAGTMADMHAMHGMQQVEQRQEMQDMHAAHGMQAEQDKAMQHHHDATPASKGRQAQIKAECCCPSHGLIDSLPHLLAPHMTSELSIPTQANVPADSIYVETDWLVRKTRIPLPPPEFTS